MFVLSRTTETMSMTEHRPARRPLQVLLIEDNPVDVMMAQEAFKEGGIAATLAVAEDGIQAMELLRQYDKGGAACLPDFIFLDLNLPEKDGHEVLEEIKADPVLRLIPVAVLSSSSDEWDIRQCYRHHANCYIVKPSSLADYVQALRSLHSFWFDLVELPARSPAC
jgi:chemotaxis family two-component system response regulator Rcp1